jgi:2-amino-4-hydroxy-6-hydroxymethyldihydropteridine diphosphokinase
LPHRAAWLYAPQMVIACIGMGSNLGKRQVALRAAAERLRTLPRTRLVALATFRQTDPVEAPAGSPKFLNSAATLETDLSPEELLGHLLQIERDLGRERTAGSQNAPRTIDLDLLLYGSTCSATATLTLPHPRMHERLFVLQPLAEIAPSVVHPRTGKTIEQLFHVLLNRPTGS